MTDPWTQAWAEQEVTPSGDTKELWCVEMLHPSFKDAGGNRTSIRAVRDEQDQSLPLEETAPLNGGETVTFKAIPFDVPWPEVQDGKTPEVRIRVDNVGREIQPYLEAAVLVNAPLIVIFRCYLWSQSGAAIKPAMDPVTTELRQVTVTQEYVEGTASPADIANLQFCRVIYDVENYPALTQA